MYYTVHPQTPDSPGNNILHPLTIGPPPDTSPQPTVHHENSDPFILNAVELLPSTPMTGPISL